VLVGGQAEDTLVGLGDLLHTRLELVSGGGRVFDSTVFDEDGEMPVSIVTLLPSVLVEVRVESVWTCGFKRLAESSLDIGLEDGKSHSVDGVLQSLTRQLYP
jgi:hypothetical protein